MIREQRTLETLADFARRGEWQRRLAAMKATQLIPDRQHPNYRPSRKFTGERIK